ncbi:glucose-1-phosphate cytidylyltransferase [Roseiconus nitratireducens]|uniref:Glucose-1-phosphate cytidylyltransferase n=1 Tax=Roseiconus nitratireducens TaxID=2605748 RepID=A0A5M6D3V4_9BACT|nr:glucose-1-phosphate cytidylyltransferase [Roseiconus nitratireducens]KAA5542164.1 glucose-1-phosphate cytidylyltransferase [Roseiconus nitratireducens]
MVKTIILCGGQGTRLREETEYRPKPMVEIGGKPILWHIMKLYAHHAFDDFILALGYRGHMIKEYFLQYRAMNSDFSIRVGSEHDIRFHDDENEEVFQATLAETGLHTMTGGRVLRAAKYVDDDTFMMTYGDGVADLNIADLMRFHKSHGKLATITTMRPMSRLGELEIDSNGIVNQFAEKPQSKAWASAGFFVLNRGVLDLIDGDDCVFEKEPLERLARDRQLCAYRHEGAFYAMDTYREFIFLNQLWDQGKAPWKVW